MPLRARDLVALGIDGQRFGIPLPSKKRRDAVDEMLHAVDAERFADARVGTLSGGEQQRVLIAHALIGRPQVLLLDEPLANLDLKSGQEVVTLLDRIADEQQIAVLLSAHEMNPLLPVMDRIVYLAGGRAASGTTDEVVRDEVLSALYGYEVHVHTLHGRILVVAGPMEESGAPSGFDPEGDLSRALGVRARLLLQPARARRLRGRDHRGAWSPPWSACSPSCAANPSPVTRSPTCRRPAARVHFSSASVRCSGSSPGGWSGQERWR